MNCEEDTYDLQIQAFRPGIGRLVGTSLRFPDRKAGQIIRPTAGNRNDVTAGMEHSSQPGRILAISLRRRHRSFDFWQSF
jgi:hypothetical protein